MADKTQAMRTKALAALSAYGSSVSDLQQALTSDPHNITAIFDATYRLNCLVHAAVTANAYATSLIDANREA